MEKIFIILAFTLFATQAHSQTVPGAVVHAMENGDVKELMPYLNSTIELQLDGEMQMSSKNHTQRQLQDFFKKHKPDSFSINYEGEKNGSYYGMGTLITKKGSYKVNMYFLNTTKNPLIYYLNCIDLRLEKNCK